MRRKAILHLLVRTLALAVGPTIVAQVAPSIDNNGVVSAASYAFPTTPIGGLARGSMFVAFGAGLGPSAIQFQPAYPLAKTLSGVSMRIEGSSGAVDAVPIYVSAGQIAGLIPSNAPLGEARLIVSYNGRLGSVSGLRIVERQWGTFATNQQGFSRGVIFNFDGPGQSLNSYVNTARQNQVVIMWGTGLGAINQDDAEAPAQVNQSAGVRVVVGGRDAIIEYAGRGGPSSGAGIDQINFRAPAGVQGCAIPVYVVVGDRQMSKVTYMSIMPNGGTCEDEPVTMPAATTNRLSREGNLGIGTITLSRRTTFAPGFPTPEVTTDSISAGFTRWATLEALQQAGTLPQVGSILPYGGCSFSAARPGDENVPARFLPGGFDVGSMQMQRAGESPGVGLQTIPRTGVGVYGGTFQTSSGIPVPYWDPIEYSFATSGIDGGAFSVRVKVPSQLRWLNRDEIGVINRNAPVSLTWTSTADADVYVRGISPVGAAAGTPVSLFSCRVRGTAGQFTVPQEILKAMVPAGIRSNGFPGGWIGLNFVTPQSKFEAPLISFGNSTFSFETWKYVNYE